MLRTILSREPRSLADYFSLADFALKTARQNVDILRRISPRTMTAELGLSVGLRAVCGDVF
jgi:hypothetical protein